MLDRVSYIYICLLALSVFTTGALYRVARDVYLARPGKYTEINAETSSTQSLPSITTTCPLIESEYRRGGFNDSNLMEKMKRQRPLFNFTLNPWNIKCEENIANSAPEWSMIVGVKSTAGNFERRDLIRRTWGSYRSIFEIRLEVFFVVGKANGRKAETELLREYGNHGDLLQLDRKEIYQEVGLKSLAAMQWVGEHCPSYWIYSSCDDDMMPNLAKLFKHINTTVPVNQQTSQRQPDLSPIMCGFSLRDNRVPIRLPRLKNRVSTDIFDGDKYPTFCAGGFYSLSIKLSNAIFRMSRQHKYFLNDDVWITGFLRLAVIDARLFPCDDVGNKHCGIAKTDPQDVKHIPRIKKAVEFWRQMQESESHKSEILNKIEAENES